MAASRYITAALALVFGAMVGAPHAAAAQDDAPPAPPAPACATASAQIDWAFPSGAVAGCAASDDKRFRLTIAPEDAGRINCSAWYAFRITPQSRGRITIDLDYTRCGHRYWPKTSTDGVTWDALPAKAVTITGEGAKRRAQLSIKLGKQPVFVAAQEIFVPATYAAWLDRAAMAPFASRALLGQSREGRSIERLTLADPATVPRETVVLIGRQHPPEVTGALTMLGFVDTLMGDSDVARAYRTRFETVVVPMLNPDGVVHGHWRHNRGGVDLNRDWGPFTQPETRLMQALLRDIDADPNRKLRMLIDFHSTNRDVFYTIPDGLPTDPPLFTKNWLDLLRQRMPKYTVTRDSQHNVGAAVSKAYVYDTYRIPGITFEIGDNTDRKLIARIARESAVAMMMTMLAAPEPGAVAIIDGQ